MRKMATRQVAFDSTIAIGKLILTDAPFMDPTAPRRGQTALRKLRLPSLTSRLQMSVDHVQRVCDQCICCEALRWRLERTRGGPECQGGVKISSSLQGRVTSSRHERTCLAEGAAEECLPTAWRLR